MKRIFGILIFVLLAAGMLFCLGIASNWGPPFQLAASILTVLLLAVFATWLIFS